MRTAIPEWNENCKCPTGDHYICLASWNELRALEAELAKEKERTAMEGRARQRADQAVIHEKARAEAAEAKLAEAEDSIAEVFYSSNLKGLDNPLMEMVKRSDARKSTGSHLCPRCKRWHVPSGSVSELCAVCVRAEARRAQEAKP